jgi:chromosome segregation ATPase
LEQELGGLKQGREELNAKLTKEQQASAESAKLIRDLEDRLGQKAAELQKATAKLKRGAIEQEQTVADLKKQLEEAVTARAQVQAQSGQLQQELGVLRETHEQLAARLADKEHKKAESAKLINELEALVSKLQTTSRGEEGCNPGTNY